MRVAVLGGGLQGACVALELAGRGVAVDLYEAANRCLTGASAQNEGKIHLGYVYANDPSLSTARTMVRGGLGFAPSLRRWLGDALDSVPVSRPFNYVVHRRSLLDADQVEAHLDACWELARDEAAPGGVDYFGAEPQRRPRRMGDRELAGAYDADQVAAVFRTPEIGIDPEALAALVRDRLHAEPGVNTRTRTRVRGVERNGLGLDVEFENGAGPRRRRYDQVVNALWDGRLAVDRSAGLDPPRPWLWRVKHYLRVRAPGGGRAVPCSTIVLGPFGDVVAYGADELYLSWYPAGMGGSSPGLEPPARPPAAGLADATFTGLAGVIPSVAGLARESTAVKGGAIFALGETDIDDPRSRLHERHEIGTRSSEGYHSIDTGKLTMAPVFGRAAAERVLAAA